MTTQTAFTAAEAPLSQSQDDASTESSTFSENIFNQNVRVGEGEASIVISPTMGNTIMQYMAAGHSPACIVCHINDIYQFQLREDTIVALLDDKWDYTDDPAPMLGVYFNGGEIPLGILRKAIDVRERGYSVEFCIEHFREVYDVEIPLEYLAEAMAQWSRELQVQPARYFPGGDGIGARDENPAFTQPPPYNNGNQSSSLSGSGGVDDNNQPSTPSAPPVSPISPVASDITLTPSATAGDSGSQYSVETPEAEMTDYYGESTPHSFGDGTESVATDDIRDRNYEPSETEDGIDD